MNTPDPGSRDTLATGDDAAWLDPALARLAFGSRAPRREDTGLPTHLAFLSAESLEIDLSDPRQRDFGKYQLIELIGQGGMGVVYRARQAGLDRDVAVKLLSAGPWASDRFIERFQHEAQAAARMQHPNIVAIYETGVHEDLNFFSMRLVDGGSLAQLLQARGPLAPADAARLLRTIAEAVDYAHRLDVLHLDLKPGNVLIDAGGEPHVADFGLARRFDELLSLDSHEVSGTPSYMSPEQAEARSQAISPATDIYGLGAILYECLTGRPPFHAGTPQATLRAVVTRPARPPSALAPRVPADLDAICLRCLAKDPAARYASARGLADDLTRFLEGREVQARPLHAGQRLVRLARREPRITGLVLLLLLTLGIGVGATALQWQRAERNASASSQLLWESRREEALRLERAGGGFDALPRLLANVREQERAGRREQAALDRRRLGLLLGPAPVLIDRMVFADASPLAVALSDDGARLAVALSDQSVRWFDAGTLAEQGRVAFRGRVDAHGQPAVPRLLRFTDAGMLRVSLDWLDNMANPAEIDTWLVDLAGRAIVEPPTAFAEFADASFSADGRYAMLRNRAQRSQLWQVQPWAPRSALGPPTDQFTPWLIGPGARYVAFLDTAMQDLRLHRPPMLAGTPITALPGSSGVSAWAHSRDGRWLALGDFEGRTYLVAPATGTVRLLPTPHSREVTWLAFSEDDAWLAIGTRDGTAYAFDVATGNPLVAGQMLQDFPVVRVGISRRQRLLVAAGRGRTAVWRLPQQGPRAVPAQRLGSSPLPHAQGEDFASAWSLETGLLATAGLDGELRLWRLPLGPTPPATAARQVPERTWFDGRQLVDVAWDRVRRVSVHGVPLGPWLRLPQPPGFAELLDGGRTLLVSVGPELRVYDSATLRLRVPPIALAATPERLVADARGRRAVVSSSANGVDGFEERLQAIDLQRGRTLGDGVRLAAPLRRLALSADGARLLALGPTHGEVSVFDTDAMRLVGDYPQDEAQPVAWAEFAGDGRSLWMVTRAPDLRLGRDLLLHWDPATDRMSQRETGPERPLAVLPVGDGVFVAGQAGDVFAPGDAPLRAIPRLAEGEPTSVLAASADGALLARASQREVQLHDARTGLPLGSPLRSDSDANDTIVQLAFAPDGTRLLARTVQGNWRSWPIGADARPLDELAGDRRNSAGVAVAPGALRLPSSAERRVLRARDPGPWPAASPRPGPATRRVADGPAIPVRPVDSSPWQVDLGPTYVFGPDDVRNPFYNVRAHMRPIPAGLQRIGGVDYDLRGMAQIGTMEERARRRAQGASWQGDCLPVPAAPIAAFHLLLQVSTPTPIAEPRTLAVLTLRYRDGGAAAVPLRVQEALPGFAGRDEAVPMAMAIDAGLLARGYADPGLANPRLANPFPQRPVRCVDLDTTTTLHAALLFAITAEPVQAGVAASSRPAVIAGAASRTGIETLPRGTP